MNAPERIWIIKDGDRNFGGHKIPLVSDRDIWADYPNTTEYIRADLVPQWQPIETALKHEIGP